MTRYYFNENPQVTLWREIAMESQKISRDSIRIAKEAQLEAKEFKELLDRSNAKMEDYKELCAEFCKISDESNSISKSCNDRAKAFVSLIRKFNSLPWYKKMFYKFEI